MDWRSRLPSEEKLAEAGKLLLRVTIAGLMLFHGSHKLVNGIEGIRETLAEKGLPLVFAYGVYVGEVVAPVLVLAGWLTRPAAIVFAFNMLVAIATEHGSDITRIGKHGEWKIELQLLYLLGGVVVALLGPGLHSVDAQLGRRARDGGEKKKS